MHSSKTCTRGRPQAEGRFFGIPLGDLGFFTSVLMAFTVGFLSFFLFTFLAIVGIMIYNGMGHRVDYADSYKYISFPAGCVVLAAQSDLLWHAVAAPQVLRRLGSLSHGADHHCSRINAARRLENAPALQQIRRGHGASGWKPATFCTSRKRPFRFGPRTCLFCWASSRQAARCTRTSRTSRIWIA